MAGFDPRDPCCVLAPKTWMPATKAGHHDGLKLFSRYLTRRVEGAGVVDFGNLLVAEAEHLAENFVGVFA